MNDSYNSVLLCSNMPKILQEQRTPSNNKRISLAFTNFSFLGRISLLATAMSVLKILAYSKDLSGPKAPCSQMVSPQDKKNCKTVSDLYQRHKLVHMLTLSKKLNGFICVQPIQSLKPDMLLDHVRNCFFEPSLIH